MAGDILRFDHVEKENQMQKGKIILSISIIIILVCTGCSGTKMLSNENRNITTNENHQLFESLVNCNTQGIYDSLEKKPDLENLEETEETMFGRSDKRALGLALDNCTEDIEVIEKIINDGADVNSIGENGATYLQKMAYEGNKKICKILISAGAKVNRKGKGDYDCNALEYKLLSDNADLEYEGNAITETDSDYMDMIDWLIEEGSEVDNNTLVCALKSSNKLTAAPIVLNALNKKGIDTNVSKSLEYAITGDTKAESSCVKNGKYKKTEKADILFFTVAFGDAAALNVLEDNGFDINKKDDNGMTLLQIAAKYNEDTDVLKYLMKYQKKPFAKNESNQFTAVTYALASGNVKTAAYLLNCGQGFQGKEGVSDFVISSKTCNGKSIDLMRSEGYKPSSKEIYESYICIIESGNIKFLNKFIDYGYPIVNSAGQDSIFEEACYSNEKMAKKLLDAGAEITELAFLNACESGYDELVPIIIGRGMDVNASYDDESALSKAISSGIEVLRHGQIGSGKKTTLWNLQYKWTNTKDARYRITRTIIPNLVVGKVATIFNTKVKKI